MKVVRFIAADGDCKTGVLDAIDTNFARPVSGDIFSIYKLGKKQKVLKLLPPVAAPLLYALGLNYRKHAEETGVPYPEQPIVFLKAVTSLIGPGAAIMLPQAGPFEVDYEGELALVIGRRGKNIPLAEAPDYIFGYTCANDVSARDWQMRLQKNQWSRGKSFDSFCPLGPWIVTADEIPDPANLHLTTRINDRLLQDAFVEDMIFSVPEIVSQLSRSLTLLPGTVILTGTPAGVGFTRQPPLFLQAGDHVQISIDGIGTLCNPVVHEK